MTDSRIELKQCFYEACDWMFYAVFVCVRVAGSEIGYLQATDPDDDQVTFSTNSAHFGVHETSGLVTLRTALDAEVRSGVRLHSIQQSCFT